MYVNIFFLMLVLLLSGCGESDNAPLAGDIEAVTVEANTTTFYMTRQAQMQATASYTHGITQRDVTENVQWHESNRSIAFVDAEGLVSSAEYGGDVEIDGSYKQFGNAVTLHVIALDSVQIVSPESNLSQGQTVQLRAKGTFEDGAVLDVTESMSWVLSAADSNATLEQNGTLYTGDANGTIEINAARYDINASLQLIVTP
jgi:hypothetical protein